MSVPIVDFPGRKPTFAERWESASTFDLWNESTATGTFKLQRMTLPPGQSPTEAVRNGVQWEDVA